MCTQNYRSKSWLQYLVTLLINTEFYALIQNVLAKKKRNTIKCKISLISYICVISNMGEEETSIKKNDSDNLTKIADNFFIVAVIFASVGLQRASADDDEGNDHHNLCNDHHFTKCSHNDETPIILPFP